MVHLEETSFRPSSMVYIEELSMGLFNKMESMREVQITIVLRQNCNCRSKLNWAFFERKAIYNCSFHLIEDRIRLEVNKIKITYPFIYLQFRRRFESFPFFLCFLFFNQFLQTFFRCDQGCILWLLAIIKWG